MLYRQTRAHSFYRAEINNTADVIAFLNTWVIERGQDCTGGGCAADLNADGAVNTADVVAFLNLWNVGC